MRQAIDDSDVEQFDKMADAWWDLDGVCKPLHQLNPFRLQYVMDRVNLKDKSVLDLGCGAGILAESLSKAGACVTAVDPAANLIDVAKVHARQGNLQIDYINTDAAQYAICHQKSCVKKFDVITCMELLEHVADPGELITICKNLLAKNGLVFFSTINRNIKAYSLAIIAAEYMFKLLPIGTHSYAKFIKPNELATAIRQNKLELTDITGINYNPLCARVTFVASPGVNYLACAKYMVD